MIKKVFANLKYKQNYWLCGGIGCSLVGAGLCVIIEAAFNKHNNQAWFIMGLAGLITLMAGLSFLIRSGQYEYYLKNNKVDD
jgi:uncharacterized membrane protein HdeD (DUF308 family)